MVGDTAPTSNVGPWLRGGIAWYVWDSVTGSYIPIPVQPKYPFRGNLSADQDMVFGGAATQSVDLVFTESLDPNNVFGGSLFSAPINGYYQINASARIGYPAGAPAPLTTLVIRQNGINLIYDAALLVTPDQGMISINSIIQLSAGDSLGVRISSTASAAGTVRVNTTGTYFCGSLVQPL